MKLLEPSFYRREDVTCIAQELLGKVICSKINGVVTGGVITETEAYAGAFDRASHAYGNRRTARTETMYRPGGVAYIYLCYGIHHLFNFVTGPKNMPHAVLLRGIYPLNGIEVMEARRKMKFHGKGFSDGPGKVTTSLGLTVKNNGIKIGGDLVWVEDRAITADLNKIIKGPRVGVAYAGEDAFLPYRYIFEYKVTK